MPDVQGSQVTAGSADQQRPGPDIIMPPARSPLCGSGTTAERRLGWALALLAAAAVAAGVAPELAIDCPDLNDSAYHVALTLRADEALQRGESPIDFWLPDIALGFPLLRHYQHLPHIFLVALYHALGGAVSIPVLYRVVFGGLLALFPLSLHLGLSRFGLSPLAAGCAALISPLLSTPHLYGLGFESYTWGGSGLYAQLFAAVLFPLALAESYRAVCAGRGLAVAAVLLAATFVSQLVYGYMAALSVFAFVVPGGDRRRRALRIGLLLATAFLVGSYFFVPALRDAEFANHSVWEKQEKWDSLGAATVLGHFIKGRLFDNGHGLTLSGLRIPLPVISLLAVMGLSYAVWRGGERLRLIAGLFVVWLLLYFGRPTWGRLIDWLPLSGDIPLHRLIGAVHVFGLILAGCGLALLLGWIGILRSRRRAVVAIVALLLCLSPAIAERTVYLNRSRGWKRDAVAAVAADTGLRPLLAELRTLRGGRAYVGIPTRKPEYLRVGDIPLTAFCLVDGIDTLGFLWIAITYAGDVQVWFNPDNELHCRTFGVRYLVFDQDRAPPAFARLLKSCGRYRVYEVEAVSYFGVVDVPFAVSCTKRSVYKIGHAWLLSALPGWQIHPALAIGGRAPTDLPCMALEAGISSESLTKLTKFPAEVAGAVGEIDPWSCVVRAARPAAVMRRCGYHPGLQATVDGVPSPVFPVTPGFAATRVAEGEHTVRFSYVPTAHWPWLVLGALALVLSRPASRWVGR